MHHAIGYLNTPNGDADMATMGLAMKASVSFGNAI
jgi:hypothetical protein